MGAVYLAYDQDLGRQVALKLVRSEYLVQPEALARFRQELLLASKISHRNVLRLHDLSQTGDTKFISMAYVDGEDLHRLLVREGKLPLERMLNIARQLCSALEAAHAEGVVHRDLKPQNILLAKDDHVFVSDFGLAKPLDQVSNVTQAGQMLGTPRYMAPEQVEAREVDARTDIYALGLLFYEMLTGDIPYSTESTMQFMYKRARETPPAPKTVVADIPDWLNGVVMKCLERDPADRYQTATGILSDIDAQQKPVRPTPVSSASPSVLMPIDGQVGTSGQPTRRSWKFRMAGAAALVVLIVAAIAGGLAWRAHEKTKLTDRDTIVLADFANKTGEAVFDEALKQGLAVQLEQSPFLNILPDTRVRQTLRLMNKPADERITRDIAREICLRQGAKAFITGSIAPLGSSYVIGLEAVNSQTGDFIAREQAQSARKEEVLQTLSDLSSTLRRRLGESLSSIQKFDAPLQVTTSSLEALKAFATGAEASRTGKYTEAIPRLKTAIELDSNFALAYQALSAAHRNTRQVQLARQYAEKAFALRDRVTELERLRIAISYYRNVTVELDRARETVTQLQGAYPRDLQGPANMANLCILLGQPEEAVKAAQAAIQMGSTGSAAHANLSLGLVRLNRFQEAKEVAEQASREGLDSYLLRAMRFQVAYVSRDEVAIKRLFDETQQKSGVQFSLEMQAQSAAFEGRLKQSQELWRRLAETAESGANAELAFLYRSRTSRFAALLGECTPARSLRPPANVFDLDNEVIENVATGLALCGGAGAETIAVDALKAYPKSTLMNGQTVPIIRATSALQQGNGQAALQALEPARRHDAATAFRTQYLRGLAYLNLKSGTLAMAEFQSILDHRGQEPVSPLYPLAHLGLARAAVMAGDIAKARKAYQEFLVLWKDADDDLAPLRAARQEYERIKNQ
jgi:tetratricopeptide (TPR) repeat protein